MKTQNLFKVFLSFALLCTISLTASRIAFAQTKFVGELTITGATEAENFVTVNGERVVNGRSITSPAEIVTSAQTVAKVTLAKTGVVILSPNSKLNLSFDAASISGDFAAGKLTVDALPGTTLNLQTADGSITVADRTLETVINLEFVNGRTRLSTLSGVALFNGVPVPAGQIYPSQTNSDNRAGGAKSGGANNALMIILAVAGAVGVGIALGLKGGGNDDATPVSPTV